MLMKPNAVKKWWEHVLQSQGRIDEENSLLPEQQTVVSKTDLRTAFHIWNSKQRGACIPIGEREFGRIFKIVVPDATITRPRIDGKQVPSLILPPLPEDDALSI